MPDLNRVRRVLREKLLTVPGIPPEERIAGENQPFDPPEPRFLWIRESHMPVGQPHVATGTVVATGIWQVDVIVSAESGTAKAEALCKDILQVFRPSTAIASQGIELRIDEAFQAGGREYTDEAQGAWWFIPISIYYRHYSSVPL